MYGQNALVMNEFLDKRWSAVRYLHSLIVFIFKFQNCIHFTYLHMQMKVQIRLFQHHISHHGHLTKIIYCSPITTPELMHQQLERSFSSPEVSLPKTIGSGFVLEHFLDFLLFNVLFIAALTYLNRKWSYLVPTQSFFYREMKFQSWQILVWKMNFSSWWFKSRHCGWWKWQNE